MIWKVEETSFLVFILFFVKSWAFEMGKGGGKECPVSLGGVSLVAEAKEEVM